MNKTEFIQNVLADMSNTLNTKELERLEKSIKKQFEIKKEQDEISNEKLLEKFSEEKLFKGCKQQSVNNYCAAVRQLLKTVEKSALEITSEELNMYIINYAKEHNVKETTINNTRRYLSSFFSYLANKQIIPVNIALDIPCVKVPVVIKQAYTDRQLEMIKDEVKDNIRNRAIIEVLDNTGLRVSELCNLDIESFGNGNIIIGKGNKQRKIFLSEKCKYWVEKYLNTRKDKEKALFVTEKARNGHKSRISKHSVEIICNNLSHKLNFDIYPHKFRRTFCTRLLSRGMAIDMVMYIMGHSSADTTMIYRSISDEEVVANLKRYN